MKTKIGKIMLLGAMACALWLGLAANTSAGPYEDGEFHFTCDVDEAVWACDDSYEAGREICEMTTLCLDPVDSEDDLKDPGTQGPSPLLVDCTDVSGTTGADTIYVGSFWRLNFFTHKWYTYGKFGYCISGSTIVECDTVSGDVFSVKSDQGSDTVGTVTSLQTCGYMANAIGPWASLDASVSDTVLKLYGCQGDDILRGGPNDDKIVGGSGTDYLFGLAGDDLECGDSVDGEVCDDDGACSYDPDTAKDFIYGGLGDDSIYGIGGEDNLCGGAGAYDTMEGGEDNDRVVDILCSNDVLVNGELYCDWTIYGNDNNDIVCLNDGPGTFNGVFCLSGGGGTNYCKCEESSNCDADSYCNGVASTSQCTDNGDFPCGC